MRTLTQAERDALNKALRASVTIIYKARKK